MNVPVAKDAEPRVPSRCEEEVGVQSRRSRDCGGGTPKRELQRARPETGVSIVWLVVVAALTVLFWFNPAEWRFFPPCMFHQLTGLNCPGCGLTRALHELLRGHLAAAFRDHALLVLSLPWLGWLAVRYIWLRRRGRPARVTVRPGWLWVLVAVVVTFTVLRNLPAFAWLSP
jgi:hypothetical protein